MNAPIPENEIQRLERLRGYGILDSPGESAYDDLTLLAAHLCRTPIALISFVDRDRQWFKSKFGIETCETPRSISFCAHAILSPSSLFEVPDTFLDPRFSGNPLVLNAPHLRFYAGVPLVSTDGSALGTLCVADRNPRRLTREQAAVLGILGRQAVALLDVRRRRRILNDVVRDRTAKLRASNEMLQAESRRTLDLARRAEEAAASKDEFLSMMSHELRTPMNAVLGMTGLLIDSGLSSAQRELAQAVLLSGGALLRILDDLLEFTKLGTDPFRGRTSEFNLLQLMEGAARQVSDQARDSDRSVTCRIAPGVPERLRGNPPLLVRVLRHLLTNAVKFTLAGDISLEVRPGPLWPASAELMFEVHDTGPGISEEDQRRLFQPFIQVDRTTTRRIGGMGLGLAICRRLVQLMGGTIGVRSGPGQGTTFWFRLPCEDAGTGSPVGRGNPALEAPTWSAPSERKAGPSLRVLVAVPNPTSRKLTARLLAKRGFDVETAASGMEVLSLWEERRYSLILLECCLPDMDGFEVSRRIRCLERLGSQGPVLIVALSADPVEESRGVCLDAGIDAVLGLPIDVGAFQTLIHQLLIPLAISPGSGLEP